MAYEPRTDDRPDELPEIFTEHDGLTPRQRSPRTDPSMRDGDSSHGNPYEMEGSAPNTDNDTGDMEDEPVRAGIDGGAAEGTTAELRADVHSDEDDFTLRAGDDGPDAGPLDEDRPDDAPPPAVTDVLPHPVVEPGEDGSTVVGRNIPAPSAARVVNAPAAPQPTHETGEREPAGMLPAHEMRGGEPAGAKPAREDERHVGNLPIEGYEQLTVVEIVSRVISLPAEDLKHIRTHEARHRKRKTLLAKLDRLLDSGEGKKPRRRRSNAGGEE